MGELLANYSLKSLNTFGVEAKARYFMEVSSLEALRAVLQLPEVKNLPLLVLGEGSNVLFTRHFEGLVLKINLKGIKFLGKDSQFYYIQAAAGENWHQFVQTCLANHWAGVENLSLIPGTVGAAPVQNIGAYGVELKDVFYQLEAVDITSGKLCVFSKQDCQFGYRDSIFKRQVKGKYIITSVTFQLFQEPRINISYGNVKQTLAEMGITQPTIWDVSRAIIHIRQSKLPCPTRLGNAGSFFKNPEVPQEQATFLKSLYPHMPFYPSEKPGKVKLAAGWLIEQCGWKGKRIGKVGTYDRQALVVVNYGGASGAEIWQLAEQIRASVAEKFNLWLEPEVQVF
ncbi:MAG: UDP-N-acetylmuramate dehydrogenase [Cytophagales bacterium]|nr:UDP-N-acetylmuramate dehydrogenase [Bernardetiaceae bacterium]MDW8209560.1 UDP-N-acetylmuramate dehydrogenase [Cytophagales bacterium]